jgi:hypothetical protein
MKRFTKQDHIRKTNKAKLASQVLAGAPKGEDNNVLYLHKTVRTQVLRLFKGAK